MATGTLTPTPYQTVLDLNGKPVSGAKITTYLAGTTTLVATYTDVALSVANANPIIADSAGRYVAFLSPGASYKFVITDSLGASIRTQDNLTATPSTSNNNDITGVAGVTLTAGLAVYLSDGSGGLVAGSWYLADSANTYSSTTPQIGIVPATIVSGATGTIRLQGVVSGLAGLTVGTLYYVGTAGTLTSTAPLNRRQLGSADTTSSLVLLPQQSFQSLQTTITSTAVGTQNDFAPGLSGNTILRMNNASLVTITGFTAGYPGQRLTVVAIASQVDFTYLDAASVAANRLLTVATAIHTSLVSGGGGSADFVYDGTFSRWVMVNHEQGGVIAFTSTWAASGTQPALGNGTLTGKYLLRGKQIYVEILLTAGSTTTYGTGTYTFSLPQVAASVFGLLTIWILHSGAVYLGTARLITTSTIDGWDTAKPAAQLGATSPVTFASTDQIWIIGSYLVA